MQPNFPDRTSLALDAETRKDLEYLMRRRRQSSISAMIRQLIAETARHERQIEAEERRAVSS
jgi:hypothetical protein